MGRHFLFGKPVSKHFARLLFFLHKLPGSGPLFSRSTHLLCGWSYLLGGCGYHVGERSYLIGGCGCLVCSWNCLLGGKKKWTALILYNLDGLQHSLRRFDL